MKKVSILIHLLLSLTWFASSCNQSATTDDKMSVEERMAKARAAKSEKKANKSSDTLNASAKGTDTKTGKLIKATTADYQTPVDKILKGPNGEAVHVGERGAKFYINKNGNKTYLSSNQ